MRSGFIDRILGKRDKLNKQTILDYLLEVAAERDLLTLIFDSISEGILVVDNAGEIRFANKSAGELLSFEPTASQRKRVTEIIRWPEVSKGITQALHAGAKLPSLETTVLVGQAPRVLKVDFQSMLDHHGGFGGVLAILLDITEEKLRKAQAAEAKRLHSLATLSANLAHEIRNPLNAMGIHAQLLERQFRKMEHQENATILPSISVIREEIRNLNERLTRYLDAARPRQPQFETVSIHDLMEETLKLIQPEFVSSGITTTYYPPEVHATVMADRVDLRKAILNIFKNAVEAMPNGGQLDVRVRVTETNVNISFDDDGPGIPENQRESVFDLGFTTKENGSGLGLAQVDRCIREHFGQIQIESSPGQGTQVLISLPVHTQGQRLLGLSQAKKEKSG